MNWETSVEKHLKTVFRLARNSGIHPWVPWRMAKCHGTLHVSRRLSGETSWQSAFTTSTRSSLKTMKSWLKFMNTATQGSHKLAPTFLGDFWNPQRQISKKPFSPSTALPLNRLGGLKKKQAKLSKIHIHYAMCGHGGERWVEGAALDGYHAETKTFFQYHCCYWHGYPKCFPNNRKRYIFRKDRFLFKITLRRTRDHRKAGYNVIEAWQCETEKKDKTFSKIHTRTYLHAFLYHFESVMDSSRWPCSHSRTHTRPSWWASGTLSSASSRTSAKGTPRLAVLLQQYWRGSWPASHGKNERFLQRKEDRHPETQHPRREAALSAP